MAFVIALFAVVVLMLMGGLFMAVSMTESNISSNEKKHSQAFELADAGIHHTRKAIIPLSPSALLDGTDDVFAGSGKGKGKGGGGNTANLAGGSYTISVTNNIAANGFPRGTIPIDPASVTCIPTATKDCDRILVLTSTATYEDTQRTIEAIVEVPTPGWGAVYVMDGTDAGTPVQVEDFEPGTGSEVSGYDCNPPSAGGGAGPGPHITGIATQSSTSAGILLTDLDTAAWGVTGAGKAKGKGGGGSVEAVANSMSDEDFETWVGVLTAASTDVGVGDCGGNVPGQYGTPANPQICWHNGNVTGTIPDGSSGAGILIVNDFTPGLPGLPGLGVGAEVTDFTYEGIVIVVGDGRFRTFGTTRIYGAVIQKNFVGDHSGETRLRMRDDSRICYSSMTIRTVQEMLRRQLLAWYER
ncbi:MAG: hypothetical protein ACE5G5_03040 [Candidatus Methylomirabilales bacterium]